MRGCGLVGLCVLLSGKKPNHKRHHETLLVLQNMFINDGIKDGSAQLFASTVLNKSTSNVKNLQITQTKTIKDKMMQVNIKLRAPHSQDWIWFKLVPPRLKCGLQDFISEIPPLCNFKTCICKCGLIRMLPVCTDHWARFTDQNILKRSCFFFFLEDRSNTLDCSLLHLIYGIPGAFNIFQAKQLASQFVVMHMYSQISWLT